MIMVMQANEQQQQQPRLSGVFKGCSADDIITLAWLVAPVSIAASSIILRDQRLHSLSLLRAARLLV